MKNDSGRHRSNSHGAGIFALALHLLLLILCAAPAAIAQVDSTDQLFGPSVSVEDSILLALRLPPLSSADSFPDSINVLQMDFGSARKFPHYLIRIRWTGVDTTGTLYLWWPGLHAFFLTSPGKPLSRDDEENIRDIRRMVWRMYRCGPVTEGGGFEGCSITPDNPTDWPRLMRDLDSLGIMELPQQKEEDDVGDAVLDGLSFRVELRTGEKYRIYQYSGAGYTWSDGAIIRKLQSTYTRSTRR